MFTIVPNSKPPVDLNAICAGKNILALDPAAATGFAHSSGRSGTWSLMAAPGEHGGNRLMRLRMAIRDVHGQLGVDLIAFEDAGFGSHNPHVKALHDELRGTIKLCAAELAIPFVAFNPMTIKRFATGSGGAMKQQMMAACERMLGIRPADDNEADALWILCMAAQGYRQPPSQAKLRKATKKRGRRDAKLF